MVKRLTNKHTRERFCKISEETKLHFPVDVEAYQMHKKLEELENIEGEMGIGLNILFEVLSCHKIVHKSEDGEYYEYDKLLLDYENGVILCNYKEDGDIDDLTDYVKIPLNEYGKTWALGKKRINKWVVVW